MKCIPGENSITPHWISAMNLPSDFTKRSKIFSAALRVSFKKTKRWRENDNFFYDCVGLEIADACCFITALNDEIIGFINWDPRNSPEYAIIGDNCIITKHKGKGYGKLQLQEAINRIIRNGGKKIYVSTGSGDGFIPARRMYECVGFTRLDNSTLQPWQIEQKQDFYYIMDASHK